jgi:histidinol-phosphate aminotransferase
MNVTRNNERNLPMPPEILDGVDAFLQHVRKDVRNMPRYNAGLSIDYVREQYGVTKIAKLGSNENPFGPSPRVIEALTSVLPKVALYPEASCDPLRMKLAQMLNVAPERFIFGNGSEDIIAVIVHTFLSHGSRVVTFAPSFGLHVSWPQSVGAIVHAVPVDSNYTMDIDQVLAALTPDTRVLMFGNPSNPVGSSFTADNLRRILTHLTPETLVVFDEAYLEYASADPTYPDFYAILSEFEIPWLLLRTFSKAYGLAGLRVGYAIASDVQLIALMDRVRAPFNVNAMAQAAAIAALDDMPYVESVVTRTIAERERMRQEIKQQRFTIAPSLANFLFIEARENGLELSQRLLSEGVIVKPWMEPAFSNHIRVSIGSPSANDQFLDAWKTHAR